MRTSLAKFWIRLLLSTVDQQDICIHSSACTHVCMLLRTGSASQAKPLFVWLLAESVIWKELFTFKHQRSNEPITQAFLCPPRPHSKGHRKCHCNCNTANASAKCYRECNMLSQNAIANATTTARKKKCTNAIYSSRYMCSYSYPTTQTTACTYVSKCMKWQYW